MYTKYGHFSDSGDEFIITRPDTPRPWINYLTNGNYCALCSHIGGGFSFFKDHRFHSILRRGTHVHIEDMPARLFYIKDEETGEIWTSNVFPIGKYDNFKAVHGAGYTKISSSFSGIQSNIIFFVPQKIDAELWSFELENTGNTVRRLSVYSYSEMVLGNAVLEDDESRIASIFNEVDMDNQHMIFYKKWWHTHLGFSEEGKNWPYRVFLTTSKKPERMLSSRDHFIGRFSSYTNPSAVKENILIPCADGSGKSLAGVCQWRVSLKPGQTWKTNIAIGIQTNEDSEENRKVIEVLKKPEAYISAYEDTINYWKKLLENIVIKTPDEDIDRMVNYWNKYQLMINFYFGRGPSYFHKGQYPAMRDSCQDTFGVIPLDYLLAKQNILRVSHFFFSDGRACGGCNRIGVQEGPSEKVDLPLWLTMAVADYIRETGDLTLLDEVVPLMDGGCSTVYQKMIRGIDRMIEDRGEHGLPLIGKGDWNDAANMIGAAGKGESIWLGEFLCYVISEIKPYMEIKKDNEKCNSYQQIADEIKSIINEICWDGEWFIRAFKDDGAPVGARGQKEGFIWINSQTWAVLSRISDKERLTKCMESVEKYLGTEYGLMNLAPAFSRFDDTIGIISSFKKGWKENAAVFSHASSFNVVARAMLGCGKDAVDLFKRILPTSKDPDKYLLEPYVYAQFCAGPDSGKDFGTGAYHWLSGTSAWMLRAMIDYIIGVHPELNGLRISPAVDPQWKRFSMKRSFREAEYYFEFFNPMGVETGIKEIQLDGKIIEGNLLPLPTGLKHHVKVVMG